MINKYIKIRWASWAYLVLVAVKCLFVIRRTDKLHAGYILRNLWRAALNKDRYVFFKILFEEIIVPHYRLNAGVKLGRPSLTIYRKFPELIQFVESRDSSVISKRAKTRYLLIRDAAVGDVLMLTPIVRALYVAHKGDISIDISTHAKAVFDNSPYINQVLTPKQLSRGVRTYDVVADLNGVYERMPNAHPVNAYAKVVLATNIFDKKLELHPSPADASLIDEVVRKIGSPFLVVHQLLHDWPNRTISSKIWEQALSAVTALGRIKVVYVGTSQDLAPLIDAQHEDHRGRYTLQQLSLLISRSSGFIGGDSGPSHVAATTDVPIVVFYTCAHHESRMPLRNGGKFLPIFPDINCYGCLSNNPQPRPGYLCLRGDNACAYSFDRVSLKIFNFFENISELKNK